MPENKLPPPSQVLGNPVKLPPPDAVLNQSPKSSGTDYSFLGTGGEGADEIINKLDASADEKKVIKDLAIAEKQGRVSKEDVSNAILTVQGQHPNQEGGSKYYMKDGKPIPIRNDEKPPQGYDVASVWGSQEAANNDNVLTSAGKHLFNGVIGAAESIANLPQIPYGAITGEELPWYQSMKNAGDYLKFKTPDYEKTGQIFDTKNLEGVSDFFDPSRYNFTKNNIQGAVLQGLESITSFLVGTKGIGMAAKATGAAAESAGLISQGSKTAQALSGASNTGKLASGFAGSYMVNYDEALTAAEEAGLEGQNKYAFASIATIPTAILEMVGGTEGLFLKNQLARSGKKEMLKSLAVGLEKDSGGKLTKESLEGLYNATTSAATKLNGTFAGQVAVNIGGEAGTEAAQAFVLNAAKNIYDKITGEEKFKTNPFSLESFGEYVNNALAGGFGAFGPAVVGVNQKRKADKLDKQNNNAFNVVKKGEEAVTALKADIDNSVKTGDLTQFEGDNAKAKVDAYNEYYQQTNGSKLDDDEKKKVFDLAYNISGIKSEIITDEAELKKLSPIEIAKQNAKKELVKGLQKELDGIVLKENVANDENVVGQDTVNKVVKGEEKKVEQTPLSDLKKRYGKVEEEIAPTPEEIPVEETKPERTAKRNAVPKFEAKDQNGNYEFEKLKPLEKKQALHDYFDERPELNNEIEGHIEGGQNNVWKVNLGNSNRYIQFAKSIIPDKFTGKRKNFPGGEEKVTDADGREYSKFTEPVGVKLESIKSDSGGRKRVLNIYNKATGKHIVFGKELEKGTSKYSDDEIKQLQKIQKTIVSAPKAEKAVEQTKPIEVAVKQPETANTSDVKKAIQRAGQGEGGQFYVTLIDNTKHSAIRISLIGNELGIGNKGDIVDISLIKKIENPDGEIIYESENPTVSKKEIVQPIKELPKTTKIENKEINHEPIKVNKRDRESLLDEGYTEKDIDKAEVETNRIFSLPISEATDELNKKGFFNSVGKIDQWRPDMSLSTKELQATLKQLKTGKETATTKIINNFINKIKSTGEVDMIGLSGGMTERLRMPIHYFLLGEKSPRELSNTEISDELEKESARESQFAQAGQFQKESKVVGDVNKVVEKIKKSFPKVKVVYNSDLNAAGRIKGNTLEINPYYASTDTPIHEAGHIMIDAIGYENKVIQAAIKQLKSTPLWGETKKAYSELNEEQLGKEVLAEAIGREGANIFDSEVAKNRFAAILSYLFTRLKQLLGIDKNIAKSLAKQIISGVKTKDLAGENETEQLAKKKGFKTLEEMSAKDLSNKLTMSVESYRENVLKRSLEQIRKDIHFIDEALTDDKYSAEDKKELKAIRENIKKEEKRDAAKWFAYKEDVEMLSSIMSETRLEDMTDDKLIEAYNLMVSGDFQDKAKEDKLDQLKIQIAYRMFQERKGELKQYDKFVEEIANKKDLSVKDIQMKNLGHMTENQPELQKLSKMYDDTYFDMQSERNHLKTQLEAIGKDVIKEKNKQIGITNKAKEFVMSGAVKYFDFVEKPSGGYYTLEEAKKKGFTTAQTKFLKFMHDLNDLRNKQLGDMSIDEVNNDVLKVDKGVRESFQDEGILQAFSAWLGNGHNLQNVRVMYDGKPTNYGDIEKDLINKGKKGDVNKLKLVLEMANFQLKARKQLKTGTNIDEKDNPLKLLGGSEYNLSTDGRLKSKFNKPRDKDRAYSKDFYKAAHNFIDDYTHVKAFQPLLPYIQSIEHLNGVGFGEHGEKKNVAEWVKQWTDLHIFKKEKVGALGPELDSFFKLLRRLTSLSVMAFNIPAGLWNIGIGIYNTIRQESIKEQRVGIQRLLKDGVLNKKATDIIKKYQAVSFDLDSNPKLHAGKLFDLLAHGLTRFGEYFIQGSIFLGKLTEEEYNSFEYKEVDGINELVVKDGVDKNELKKKFIGYKNQISDTQGKYNQKDLRNYTAGEFGKLAGQFKTYLPDIFKQRFGEEYIDSNGVVRKGSYRSFIGQGFRDLRADIKDKGIKGFTENKDAMSNLKGLMVVAAFMAIRLGGDDDKKKRKQGDFIDQALGNLLNVFDIDQLKFMVKNPITAQSTVIRFVNVMEDALNLDAEKGIKDIKKVVPYGKSLDIVDKIIDDEE